MLIYMWTQKKRYSKNWRLRWEMWMESMHGAHARSQQRIKTSVFMSVYSPWWTWRPLLKRWRKWCHPEEGATGQNQLIYHLGDGTQASDENTDSALNVRLYPCSADMKGSNVLIQLLARKKKKIMSLTKHLRYVIPQKQKSSLSAPAHEAGLSSDERQAETTASMKSSAQEAWILKALS